MFMSSQQAKIISDPSKSTFDDPSFFIASQLSTVLKFGLFPIIPMRTNKVNLLLFRPFSQWIVIIGTICNQSFCSRFRSSRAVSGKLDLSHNVINQGYFVREFRGNGVSQRNIFAIEHRHPLRSFDPFGFSDPKAPFFAVAKLSSINAFSQSRKASSAKSARNLRQTSSQTPSSSHRSNRLQHVKRLVYWLGESFHRAPVCKIQKMPSNTSRLLVCGRPTRPCLGLGSKGQSFSIANHL